jgi:heme A synthase
MQADDSAPPLRPARAPQRLALAVLLLMAVVVVASAWLRLAQPRPACGDWPGCRAADRPALGVAAAVGLGAEATLRPVRNLHRMAATAVLVLLVVLAARARRRAARDRVLARRALAMLALALGLALLGVVTPGSRSAAVLLGNLLGGLLLFALAWTTWRGLQAPPLPRPALTAWAAAAAVAWALQAAFGARAGAGVSDMAPVAHLALALFVVPATAGIGHAARRQGRAIEGLALIALAALQTLLGAASAALAAPAALVLVHNAAAAAGFALLVGLACSAPPRRAGPARP